MRARWHLRVNALVVAWLIAAAVIAVVHRWVPQAGWLMVHLLLLGAVSTAILIWSAHFAEAVRRRPLRGGHLHQAVRLGLHTAGALAVVAGLLTDTWPVVLAGATAVALNALWHMAVLVEVGRRGLGVRLGWTTWFFVASAAMLPVGAALGAALARGPAGEPAARTYVAHVTVMLLGWVGLTVTGTLVTLWPTMLRVAVDDDALPAARRGLAVLCCGLGLVLAGTLVGVRAVAVAGLLTYVAGLVVVGRHLVAEARRKPPEGFAPWSVGSAALWLAVSAGTWAGVLAAAPTWAAAQARFGVVLPAFAIGFAAQVLLGALSHLGPMVMGGGPAAVRAARAEVERAAGARIVIVNVGLAVYLLPTPSLVRVGVSMLVLAALVATPVLVVRAALRSRRARSAPQTGPVAIRAAELLAPRAPGRHGTALAGAAAVVLVVAGGIAGDPAAVGLGSSAEAGVTATGRVIEVEVEAREMRFHPDRVEVAAGDELVLVVTNTDADVHDLVLDNGVASGRLAPGATARVEVGVIGRSMDGWCSVAGHRQMGMVFAVDVTGLDGPGGSTAADGVPGDAGSDGHDGHQGNGGEGTHAGQSPGAAPPIDVMAAPGPDHEPYDATLAPAPDGPTVHRVRLEVQELEQEVAPGVVRTVWTFGGTAPGPVLRGKVGDRFEITLVNDGTIGHSIDFHAGALAPDEPMRTIGPGEELTYHFTAERSGIWMYHCSTMPMSVHIANGMFGAVVIDPPDLPEVDREYLLIQHELYLGGEGELTDVDALLAERPTAVVFNGHASHYRHAPLEATVGERVRLWVLDAGPNRPSAFHVVGGQFDTVYLEGAYTLGGPGAEPAGSATGGSQVLGLLPAMGGFVELVMPEAGHYTFVNHAMIDAERGAAGVLRVTER